MPTEGAKDRLWQSVYENRPKGATGFYVCQSGLVYTWRTNKEKARALDNCILFEDILSSRDEPFPHEFRAPNSDYCAVCGCDEEHPLHDTPEKSYVPEPEPEEGEPEEREGPRRFDAKWERAVTNALAEQRERIEALEERVERQGRKRDRMGSRLNQYGVARERALRQELTRIEEKLDHAFEALWERQMDDHQHYYNAGGQWLTSGPILRAPEPDSEPEPESKFTTGPLGISFVEPEGDGVDGTLAEQVDRVLLFAPKVRHGHRLVPEGLLKLVSARLRSRPSEEAVRVFHELLDEAHDQRGHWRVDRYRSFLRARIAEMDL